MKNKILLLLLLAAFSSKSILIAQSCTIGTINQAVWGTPDDFTLGFTIDSDPLDTDTVRVTQGQDTIVYMQYLLPKKQNITSPISGTATVTSVQILSVAGLPLGLSWVTDQYPTNEYFPQTYRYGVVSLCGETFAAPGVRTLTVTAEGCGSLSGLTACDGLSFPLYLEVLPGTGSGPIQISPPLSCDSANVTFNTTLSSPNAVLFPVEYSWLFHDGTTATGKPVNKNYNAVGNYPVQMTVNIYEYYISRATVAVTGGWTGDIEEVTTLQDPELYLRINGGAGVVQTSTASSGKNKTFNGLNIPISDFSVSVNAFDEDNGPPFGSADDDLGTTSVTFSSLSDGLVLGYVSGNFTGTLTINKRFSQSIVEWDTVKILPPSNVNLITNDNGLEICQGLTTTLDAGPGYDIVQWYSVENDLLVGETNQTLVLSSTGQYYAELVETGSICPSFSDTIDFEIQVVDAPVIQLEATLNSLYVNNPNNYDVQWYANGSGIAVPIPAANGDTLVTFNPANAPFTVLFTSAIGCEALSAPFDICVAGTSSASGNLVSLSSSVTLTHSNFNLKPGNDIAWAISSQQDGPITSAAQLQTAIDAGWVLPATSATGALVNCNSLPASLPNGEYYFTPISAAALIIDSIIHFPDIDSGCVTNAQLCLALSATPGVLLVTDSLIFTFPDGSTAGLRDIVPASFQALLPDTIDQGLINLLPSVVPGGSLCFGLTDLYGGNPNGTWTISSLNVGTGSLTIDLAEIVSEVFADSCPAITVDQIITIPAQSFTIAPNSTASVSFTLPPVPSNFPTINGDCNVFGTSSLVTVDCGTNIRDLLNLQTFALYPNPNNGNFTLALELYEAASLNIQIFDVMGKNIYQELMNAQVGNLKKEIQMASTLSAGFYLVNVSVDGNQIQQHFLVK